MRALAFRQSEDEEVSPTLEKTPFPFVAVANWYK